MSSPPFSTVKRQNPLPLSELIEQNIHIVASFTLECGVTLKNAPIAYKTWGRLNAARDNVMVICHALTGSADVQDWWGPMMGRGKAFDPSRFFIVCLNVLGSPYGSASPLTTNPETGKPYGPEFPPTTIRDDVRIHKLVLDTLSITSLAAVIGGSMGGMHVLEWPLCTPRGYVRHIVPLATSASHSAWCIAWGEAQRQALLADPGYQNGWYKEQPRAGMAAARVCAMLTYRSRTSFERKFGRGMQVQKGVKGCLLDGKKKDKEKGVDVLTPPPSPPTNASKELKAPETTSPSVNPTPPASIFSVQSYLRYQGQKFLARFDANCFIHITHKMDTHDIARARPAPCMRPISPTSSSSSSSECECSSFYTDTDPELDPELDTDPSTRYALSQLPPRALVIGISTDNLFVPAEQKLIAAHIPGARLVLLDSIDGHDGFLLEFEAMNRCIVEFLRGEEPRLYLGDGEGEGEIEGFEVRKTSVFGEAEVEGEIPGGGD